MSKHSPRLQSHQSWTLTKPKDVGPRREFSADQRAISEMSGIGVNDGIDVLATAGTFQPHVKVRRILL